MRSYVRMPGQRGASNGNYPGAGSPSRSHEFSQAIRYLPSLLLPQLAWRCLRMERVMGIEPIGDSRQISWLAPFGEASAIQVRDIALCGVLSGHLWQLMGTALNDL